MTTTSPHDAKLPITEYRGLTVSGHPLRAYVPQKSVQLEFSAKDNQYPSVRRITR